MERVMVVRTARVTVETDTVVVVRNARTAPAWCPDCQTEVDVITLDDVTLAEKGAAAQMHEWRNTGKLHSWQLTDGRAQICLPSLLQCFERQEIRPVHDTNANRLRRK